jgi:hypothetical protein
MEKIGVAMVNTQLCLICGGLRTTTDCPSCTKITLLREQNKALETQNKLIQESKQHARDEELRLRLQEIDDTYLDLMSSKDGIDLLLAKQQSVRQEESLKQGKSYLQGVQEQKKAKLFWGNLKKLAGLVVVVPFIMALIFIPISLFIYPDIWSYWKYTPLIGVSIWIYCTIFNIEM